MIMLRLSAGWSSGRGRGAMGVLLFSSSSSMAEEVRLVQAMPMCVCGRASCESLASQV